MRDLGAGTGGGPRAYGELTARERDVLALLAHGRERWDRGDALHQREDGRPPRETPWEFDSARHYMAFMETNYGPMLKARE